MMSQFNRFVVPFDKRSTELTPKSQGGFCSVFDVLIESVVEGFGGVVCFFFGLMAIFE